MKHSESFLEGRIRWRAKAHKFPKQNTQFWESVQDNSKFPIPDVVGKPLLLSSASDLCHVLICTSGAIAIENGIAFSFTYDAIERIRDFKMTPEEKKEDLSKLVVFLIDGTEVKVSTEPGSSAFGIWSILIMLMRMSKK